MEVEWARCPLLIVERASCPLLIRDDCKNVLAKNHIKIELLVGGQNWSL
ncbi:hypothetical protein [Moorena sp. SIO3A2]